MFKPISLLFILLSGPIAFAQGAQGEWKLKIVKNEQSNIEALKWEKSGKSLDAIAPSFLRSLKRSPVVLRNDALGYAVLKLPQRSLPPLVQGDQILLRAGETVSAKSGIGFACERETLGPKGFFCSHENGNRYEFYFYNLDKSLEEPFVKIRHENASNIATGKVKFFMSPTGIVIQSGDRVVTLLPSGELLRGSYIFSDLTKNDIDVIEGKFNGIEIVEAISQGNLQIQSENEEITKRMVQILAGDRNRNPLVWGRAGTSYEQSVYVLAKMIADNKIPQLKGWKIYGLSWNEFGAGGGVDVGVERIKEVLDAARLKKVILYFPDIENIVGLGVDGLSPINDVSSAMHNDVKLGRIVVIGTTSADGVGTFRSATKFARSFQEVPVPSPQGEALQKIVEAAADQVLKEDKVKFSSDLVAKIIRQTNLYITDLSQPKKSVDAIEALAEEYGPANPDDDETEVVEINYRMFRKWLAVAARIPSLDPSPQFKAFLKEENFLKTLDSYIVGHEAAKKAVHRAMLNVLSDGAFKVGGDGSETGVQTMFFTGPSGVGKSMSAQALSQMLREKLGIEWPVKVWQGNQYTDEGDVNIMFGAPPGYKGYNQDGGEMFQFVKNFPQSIMLFDEMDKMNRKIHNSLYKLFDDGIVIDKTPKMARFSRGMIFLTSNFGSISKASLEIPTGKDGKAKIDLNPKSSDLVDDWDRWHIFNKEPRNPAVKDWDNNQLKQELLNQLVAADAMSPQMVGRIGFENIVIFHHFSRDQIKEIGRRYLAGIAAQYDETFSVKLEYSKDLLEWATAKAWGLDGSNTFNTGARSMLNVVKSLIRTEIILYAQRLDPNRTQVETWTVAVDSNDPNRVLVRKK